MEQIQQFLASLLAVLGLAVNAGTPVPAIVDADSPEFEVQGIVDSITDTTWVVGGQPITVDPALLGTDVFIVGDLVEVEGFVDAQGFFIATEIDLEDAEEIDDSAEDLDDDLDDDADEDLDDDSVDDSDESDDGDSSGTSGSSQFSGSGGSSDGADD